MRLSDTGKAELEYMREQVRDNPDDKDRDANTRLATEAIKLGVEWLSS